MTKQEFIFSQAYPTRIYRHIVFWITYYLFSLLVYFHDGLEKIGFGKWMFLQSTEVFFHVLIQMIFCYGVLYFLLPRFLNRKKNITFILGVILWSIVIYFFYNFQHNIFFKRIHFHVGLPFRPPALVYWFSLISLLSYFPASTGLAIAIKVIKNWYLRQQENQQLVRENANAELQLLKAQVHPHFLFNTLNNIYSFALNKSTQTPMLVQKLSDTLNYMINECETTLVPLEKEIQMIKDYMELEKIRYGSRLEMQVKISGDLKNKLITPLLMIPFVENSFKHGTSQMLAHPWIKLQIVIEENSLHFELSNSKPAQPASFNGKNGIGLSNVNKRLKLLYPFQHQLQIESSENMFFVKMKIPLEYTVTNSSATLDTTPVTSIQTGHHVEQ